MQIKHKVGHKTGFDVINLVLNNIVKIKSVNMNNLLLLSVLKCFSLKNVAVYFLYFKYNVKTKI